MPIRSTSAETSLEGISIIMTDETNQPAGPGAEEPPADRPGLGRLNFDGLGLKPSNFGGSGAPGSERRDTDEPPANLGRPGPGADSARRRPPADGQASSDEDESAGLDDSLGDDDDAWGRHTARESIIDGMHEFGVRGSGVYIAADALYVSGDVAGGDIHKGTRQAAGLVLERILTTALLEPHRFVLPTGFPGVDPAPAGLLILRVRRRCGGTTAALRLLANGGDVIYRLRTEEPLSNLEATRLPPDAGVLLDGLSSQQAGRLRDNELHQLHEALVSQATRLVVVVDWEARLTDPTVQRRFRPLSAPLARDVVLAHLGHLLRDTLDPESVLGDESVAQMVASIDAETFDIYQLTELAHDLADMAQGQISEEEVASRFGMRARQRLQPWLDEMSNAELATVVSLATLHGLTADAVSRAAQTLELQLADAYAERKGQKVRSSRSGRLLTARAVASFEPRRSRYGVSEQEVVRFVDSSYPAQVMRLVWQEFDGDRQLYLDWLRSTAEDVEGAVRIRAATTIGYLGCFSFDEIRREIIAPWARSGNGDERERAVAALAIPARHPNIRAQVISLVRDWSGESRALKLAAVRALGVAVGEVLPADANGTPTALVMLAELARNADPQLGVAIGDSLAELITDADPHRSTEVLRQLTSWVREPRGGRQTAGAFAFLEIASTLWRERRSDDAAAWWPSLLAMADDAKESADDRRLIVELWSIAIRAPGVDRLLQRVVSRWARAAEGDSAMRAAFVELFVEVSACGPRQQNIVIHCARTWHNSKPAAPETAARLLEALVGRGSLR
jgi:hypothetical protein